MVNMSGKIVSLMDKNGQEQCLISRLLVKLAMIMQIMELISTRVIINILITFIYALEKLYTAKYLYLHLKKMSWAYSI